MERKLYRRTNGQMIFGVCNGIANYIGIDVSVVRLVAVILSFASIGSIPLIYLIAAIILPEMN